MELGSTDDLSFVNALVKVRLEQDILHMNSLGKTNSWPAMQKARNDSKNMDVDLSQAIFDGIDASNVGLSAAITFLQGDKVYLLTAVTDDRGDTLRVKLPSGYINLADFPQDTYHDTILKTLHKEVSEEILVVRDGLLAKCEIDGVLQKLVYEGFYGADRLLLETTDIEVGLACGRHKNVFIDGIPVHAHAYMSNKNMCAQLVFHMSMRSHVEGADFLHAEDKFVDERLVTSVQQHPLVLIEYYEGKPTGKYFHMLDGKLVPVGKQLLLSSVFHLTRSIIVSDHEVPFIEYMRLAHEYL